MTVETGAIRAEMRVIRSYWEHGSISEQDTSATIEQCFALCDALDEERERVRVLRAALDDVRGRVCFMSGQASSTALHNAALDVIDAALATAGGEGAET